MQNLNINAINIGGGTQCREVIDQPLVIQYLDSMKDGDVFPPVDTIFDGSTYWLVDGFHRYHAYKMLGLKVIDVNVKEGTLYDAQLAALEANFKHGKPLTNADKHKKVLMALSMDGFDKKTDNQIAQICKVSASFVGAIRHPEVKEKQQENRQKSNTKKVQESEKFSPTKQVSNNITEIVDAIGNLPAGAAPDDDEIKSSELALQADQESMYKLLESSDPLREAYAEIKVLNSRIAVLEVRLHGEMYEKNVAIKMVKDLQKQLDKLRKTK